MFGQVEFSPGIVEDVLGMLRIYGIEFSGGGRFGHQRANEKLGKAVECSLKCAASDFQMVICLLLGSIGVVATGILGNILSHMENTSE